MADLSGSEDPLEYFISKRANLDVQILGPNVRKTAIFTPRMSQDRFWY